MSWAVGEDASRQRHIGYGVPATCDHPGCGEAIDRGLAYACGGGVASTQENCGLFFCDSHLSYGLDAYTDRPQCERCADGLDSFDPTPDVPEWTHHVLTDESWATWREENPERAEAMRAPVPS